MKVGHTMKPSGLGWAGDVPRDWDVAPLYARYRVDLGKMLSPEATDGPHQRPYLGNQHVQWDRVRVEDLPTMSVAPNELERYRVRTGDVLVCEGGEIGRTAIWRGELEECCYQKALHRLRARGDVDEPRFLVYLMHVAAGQGVFEAEGNKSTFIHLTGEKLRSHRFPFPSANVQCRIADFLDRKAAVIDELIAKKERLVMLLAEKRQALITQAVTKGLDSSVPMKESGVPSFGEIPEHWKILRNKVLFRETGERSIDGSEELLTVSHITGVTPRSEKQDVSMFLAESLEDYKVVRQGDLAINTMWAWMGALGFSPTPGIVSPAYNVYRARNVDGVDPAYFEMLYRTPAHIAEMTRFSKGIWTSRLRLYPEAFLGMLSPVPPLAEQCAIVAAVCERVRADERITDACVRSVEKLREYRQSLITAVVTGRLDVSAASLRGDATLAQMESAP